MTVLWIRFILMNIKLSIKSDSSVNLLFLFLFAISGLLSLFYEIIWSRQLELVLGSDQLAISIVLAVFMSGLAIGSLVAARLFSKLRYPLIFYAFLEIGIGIYGLLFLMHSSFLSLFYKSPLTYFYNHFWIFIGIKIILSAFFILIPTILMGMTLPLITYAFSNEHQKINSLVGKFYGANTLGALFGVIFCGFVFLPFLGLNKTLIFTIIGNIILGLVVLFHPLSRQKVLVEKKEKTKINFFSLTLLLAFLAGFSSLIYELAWFRLMVLVVGASIYAFSLMLIAFLLGIGIGGWFGGKFADFIQGKNKLLFCIGMIEFFIALFSWLLLFLYNHLPFAYLWFYQFFSGNPYLLFIAKLLLAISIMLIPTFFMGIAFPVLVKLNSQNSNSLNQDVGQVFSANTIGAIFGALLSGLFFLPVLHVQKTILLAIGINILATILAVLFIKKIRYSVLKNIVLVLFFVNVFLWMVWQKPIWNPTIMTAGVCRMAPFLKNPDGLREFINRYKNLLFYQEGSSSIVTVGKDNSNGNLWLANNGNVDASSLNDLDTEILLAQLPFVFRPNSKNALVIGLGSGISAGSISLHKTIENMDIAELEKAVVNANPLFDPYNHQILKNPRIKMHITDARTYLLLSPSQKYDLIISEPSNPWISGVSNLFTKEFFEIGKEKLSENGIWSQWLQMYSLRPQDLQSLLATFSDVFPYVCLFRVGEGDVILLGSKSPLNLSPEGTQILFSNQLIVNELKRININSSVELWARYLLSKNTLLKITAGATLNTDDNMLIEFSTPLSLNDMSAVGDNWNLLSVVTELPLKALKSEKELMELKNVYIKHQANIQLNAMKTIGWKRMLNYLSN